MVKMKPKLSEWQPLDLVDKEAVRPLRSFNSRVASGDQRYYTLGNDNNAVCISDSDHDDEDSVTSEVEYLKTDPIGDELTRSHQRRWRRVMWVLVISVILITCLVVVVIFQHFRINKENNSKKCMTESCVKGAAYIMNKMDTKMDPCKDFHQFACGNWEKTTHIPDSKAKYGTFSQINDNILGVMKEIMEGKEKPYKHVMSSAIHKAWAYYKMCADEAQVESDGIQPMLKLIKDLGSWTMTSDPVSGTFNPSKWSAKDAILLAHRLNFGPLFGMGLDTDEKNSSSYKINFAQSGLTLGDQKNYFKNNTKYEKLKDAFIEFGKGVVTLLGGTEEVEKKVAELYDFEKQLAEIRVSREDMIDPKNNYNKMTLQKFQDTYLGDWLNLKNYMQGIFADVRTITMDTEVIVVTPAYFKKLDPLIKATNEETLANYIVWRGVVSMVGYSTKAMLAETLKLDRVESGVKEYPPRWKRCISKVEASLGFATGALYVQDQFDINSKSDVDELFERIRSSFIKNLRGLEWMDDATKSYAEEKALAVQKMLGYPEYIMDPALLDKYYENLTLVEGKFFETRLSMHRYSLRKNLWKYGTVPDRNEWGMVPTTVNGYYSPDFNHIAFPAGILQPPLYNPTSPKSFNFGSFGMICGHELTHGFDNKGREFDKFGNMRNWWTNSSTEKFKKRTECFVNFYSNYSVEGTPLNGETTLGENIADNGGMKVAYLAFQEWKKKKGVEDSMFLPVSYTPEQLFFIGMAQLWCSHYTPEYMQQAILVDAHSIAKFRVLGSMSNSVAFAKAFSCPANSPMNPDHKCSVW